MNDHTKYSKTKRNWLFTNCLWGCTMVQLMGKKLALSQSKLNIQILYHLETVFLSLLETNEYLCSQNNLYTIVYISFMHNNKNLEILNICFKLYTFYVFVTD